MPKLPLLHLIGGVLILAAASLGGTASCTSPSFDVEPGPSTGSGGSLSRSELCGNGEPDGGETDVDCGGVCEPCPNGKVCEVNDDCIEGTCADNRCQPATCIDNAVSPGETGMDCGGDYCVKCAAGGGCLTDTDCLSDVCSDDVCVEPNCGDGKQNGEETGVDCGGLECEGCAAGAACDDPIDCLSGECREGTCAVVCAAGSGDCDGDDLCETNTTLDVEHCGACDIACDLEHAVPQCVGGSCEILECVAPFEDCDGNPDNGCEVNLTDDPENCGSCFAACNDINGTPTCGEGVCGITCTSGFDDCDTSPDNGCESDLTRDVANCGECGTICEPDSANETVFCDANGCGATVCETGFGDCDGDGECETDLTESVTDCGACGNLCVAANGSALCSAGSCAIDTCSEGFNDCNDEYADGCEAELAVNAAHCGECGNGCGADCDAETGTCGVPSGSAWCTEGSCAVKACDADFQDCNGSVSDGCEINFTTDSLNCGGCGATGGQDCSAVFPHADAHCAAGACEFDSCQGTWQDCEGGLADGCESNVNADDQDCGACGTVCATTNASANACSSGSCEPTCSGSWEACTNPENGCTTNLADDEANCGGCGSGFVCQQTGVSTNNCVNSACSPECSSGRGDCDTSRYNGCEVNTNTSATHCGACDDGCSSANGGTAQCASGQCSVSCGANFKSCNSEDSARDGCETDVRSNTTHCGACNDGCSGANGGTAQCASSQCSVSCGANFKNCNNENTARDGCETDVRNDPDNCGACNTTCVFCDGTSCLQNLDITVVKTTSKQESSTSTGCGATQLTLTHTLTTQTSAPEYDYRLLLLGLAFQANDVNGTPCQVAYGGQNFEQVTNLGPNNGAIGSIYMLREDKIRAASGSSLTVRINEYPGYGIIAAQLIELTGVDQTNPLNGSYQTSNSSFTLNPSAGEGLSVGDTRSLVYTFIARRDTEPTASFRNFYEAIGNVRAGSGHFFANESDAQSTITWAGGGYSHRLNAVSVQRAVTTCQTGC